MAALTSNFWLLRSSQPNRLAVEAPDIRHEPIICSANERHKSGVRRIGDLSITVPSSFVKDFTWSWSSDILISQKVLDIFEKHNVTGFKATPAKVIYSNSTNIKPPTLFELVVTGWGGNGAATADVKLLESCPSCGHKHYSIAEPSHLIDPAAWDGSDLFIVWPIPKYRFASDRLANIMREERISGVKLIPASEIPMKQGNKVSPGRLTYWMPEARAHELGDVLGIS
jgi:hypothetical protein